MLKILTRRDFLKLTGLTLGAQPVPKRDSELYPAYTSDEILSAGSLLLGPGAAPLAPLAGDVSIVKGMSMLGDAPLHEVNEVFMNTGDEEGREAIFVEQMMKQFDTSLFGIGVGVTFGNSGISSRSTPIYNLDSTSSLMGKVKLLTAHGKSSRRSTYLENLKKDFAEINRRVLRFEEVQRSMTANSQSNPQLPIRSVVPALAAEIINYVFMDIGGFSVDTHSDHANRQRQSQITAWSGVVQLIQALKAVPDGSGSLYDRTVILVTTEFARTSWAESRDGTGHNPYSNACLLAGGLIRGGRCIGESTVIPSTRLVRATGSDGRSRFRGQPIDFETERALSYEESLAFAETINSGEAKPGYEGQSQVDHIYPGNVLKTVAIAMGLNPPPKMGKYRTLNSLLKKGS